MKTLFRSGLMVLLMISKLMVKAQVPILSSYPSASATIFLDFDGQTVTGTSWNFNGPFVCGASGLNNTQITEVFNRVAEDYRPFSVNVTTDSTKYLAAPANKRIRIILTISSAWYGSAGGVSFVGSFNWGDDTPGFVFSALLNYNSKYIAEAASHETGHTLGLFHQSSFDINCVKTTEYNAGQGSGETGWAPIMGVSYYKNVTTWHNGPNSYGCNVFQNDMALIIANNGLSYRTDDYANTLNTANSLSFSNNQFQISGLIEQTTDLDIFKFTMPSKHLFHLDINPYSVGTSDAGSNIDLQVTLYNNSQKVLQVYNPSNSLNAVIDTTLNEGIYFLRIESTGNQYLPGYASLGSYSMQADLPASLTSRRLELHGILNDDKHQFDWLIDADEQVTQQILEISTDDKAFSPVTEPLNNARSFIYKPYVTAAAQYRLNVTFNNGRQFYSNIVTLHQTSAFPRPHLVSNLIYTNNISVTSPGHYTYTIYDFTGKTIIKGQLTNGLNNVSAGGIPNSMYVIRFASGTEQWTDKFVRQ